METSKEVALTICEKIQNEYPKRPLWQTMLEIEDLIDKHVVKQLIIHGVVKSLPSDEEIYSEASKYARQIKNPHNMTNIKLRQAYKNGAKLILNALKMTK